MSLLRIDDLAIDFATPDGVVHAVDGIGLELSRGEIVGVVGESGSGKSALAIAIMGLTTHPGRVVRGNVTFDGIELRRCSNEQLRQLRGKRISMIFQDPMMTLNPLLRIETQMIETILAHNPMPRAQARAKCVNALNEVGIAEAQHRIRDYPHQLSGGMQQRVIIAIALLNEPELIIADEPTTAVDVTIQAQLLHLVQDICERRKVAFFWITHDLSLIAGLADRMLVMYGGRIVERGSVDAVLGNPRHPYTIALISSMASATQHGTRLKPIAGTVRPITGERGGCWFRFRCEHASETCHSPPPTQEAGEQHSYECWLPPDRNT